MGGADSAKAKNGAGAGTDVEHAQEAPQEGSVSGSKFQGTAVGKEEEATYLPFQSGCHPTLSLSSHMFSEPRVPPQVLGVLMARQTAGGGQVFAHGPTQKYRAGSAGI